MVLHYTILRLGVRVSAYSPTRSLLIIHVVNRAKRERPCGLSPFLDQISGSVFGRDGVPHTAAECVAHPEDRDACHRVGGVLLDLLEGADALELGDEDVVIVFHDCSFDWLISIIQLVNLASENSNPVWGLSLL